MQDAPSPQGRGRGPTRRRVLFWLAAAAIAGAGLAFTRRAALVRWFVQAPLGSEPAGRLGDSAAATLDATVLALLDERVDRTHYADFFRWRAENVPGMRALFERFAVRVDADARRLGYRSFRSAPRATQRRVLKTFVALHGGGRAARSLFARDDQRFAHHVVHEVFHLFARTDAWVLSGYSAWPGVPRAIATLRRDGSVT